ncbi:MAG TPA: thioesterase family protein [Longimicrobiales bacterium]
MSDFRFVRAVAVRFRDIDEMGHAHHTLPLVYIEEARTSYWREVLGRERLDFIMGEVGVRYHQRIRYPSVVHVGVRVTRLGRNSLAMAYELRDAAGELLADGWSKQVMYDYEASASKPVPEEMRARVRAWELVAPEE